MLAWKIVNAFLIFGGLSTILAANFYRTEKNPRPFYHPTFLGHFGWKKDWWRGPGYLLQRIGTIMISAGFLSSAVYWWMRD